MIEHLIIGFETGFILFYVGIDVINAFKTGRAS